MTAINGAVHDLLTPENCTVIFIDHQPQMAFGVTSIDRQSSFATAVAIRGGRFVTAGTEREVQAHRGDKTQVIDVEGRTVIPGSSRHCTDKAR